MMHLIVQALALQEYYCKYSSIHSPETQFRVYSHKCFMTSVLKMCIAQEVCVLDVFICLLVCLSAE